MANFCLFSNPARKKAARIETASITNEAYLKIGGSPKRVIIFPLTIVPMAPPTNILNEARDIAAPRIWGSFACAVETSEDCRKINASPKIKRPAQIMYIF